MIHLPDRVFQKSIAKSAVGAWLAIRGAMTLLLSLATGELTTAMTYRSKIIVVLLVGTIGVIDCRRRREHWLLLNMGIPSTAVFLGSAAVAAIAEVLLALVLWSIKQF
jgi:hypothetical protein